jgi:hypothetical protein
LIDDSAVALATLDTPANASIRAARTIDAASTTVLARSRAHNAHSAYFHREEFFRIAEKVRLDSRFTFRSDDLP